MNKRHLFNHRNLLSTAALASMLAFVPAAEADAAPIHAHEQVKEKQHAHQPIQSVKSLRFLGEQRLPYNLTFEDTTVGGLSGIRYDEKNDEWLMISDDRSSLQPARFYTGKLNYGLNGFRSVQLTGMEYMKQPDGSLYPSHTEYEAQGGDVPDLESISLDPKTDTIWYTSEGDRSLGLHPFIRQATREGDHLSTLPLPDEFHMSPDEESGPRNNAVFEGSTFSADGESLWVAMEGPLHEDGAAPTVENGGFSRITQYDRQGNVLAQYAYPMDAIPAAPGPGKHADNGVTEILAVNKHTFLVLERAGVQAADGSFSNYIRLYEMKIPGASDIQDIDSLQDERFKPVKKRLVLDLNTLNLPKIDNVEGLSWGPTLENGNRSLVLVSDNNFNSTQVTQFLAFEVKTKGPKAR
ncbi:esterase-like activity of phytase family protein [Bacillus thermotolerans]|uniref:esterase-like activity of phytase family protein n=1 Tax=Bacillus thermotolerans TaxID=1221996 RepID=UPI000583A2F4|nr:esterase-like activity of phytase family protein [Bacillus thermotolerans]KKB36193.1 phytase [Bacillus thermotolerans]